MYQIPFDHSLHSAYNHKVCRDWVKKLPRREQLVLPVFVLDTAQAKQEIASMPEVFRYGYENINEYLEPLVLKGLKSILVFGILSDDSTKDPEGTRASAENGPAQLAVRSIKTKFPNLFVIVDICLCAFTSHGHCGVLNEEGLIDNTASIQRLAEVSLSCAKAGADMVAPSDMMDGRILAIKQLLFQNRITIPVMSYSAKFASALYGPFRDVCKSAPQKFNRESYQLPVDSSELALRAVQRDLQEGADFIMVKPITPYLDLVTQIKQKFNPIMACYHVSGEYSMIKFASQHNCVNEKLVVLEYMRSFVRAGIDVIITYFTPNLLEWLKEEN